VGDLFPEFITALPPPDTPVRMRAHIAPGGAVLPMFYEIDDDVVIPQHVHGPQWGVVLDGTMEMTIGAETRVYRRGDTYYVPGGVPHTTRIAAGYRGLDVFADPERYLPRPGQ
jgi:quercetin dioxygenase-like cupin family protein